LPTVKSPALKKFQPTSGIPPGSIVEPQIANCILDGLERFCLESLPKTYKLFDTQKLKALKLGIKIPQSQKRKIMILRYADDILILGKSNMSHFRIILDRLKSFLRNRGLNLKNEKSVDVQKFSPGKSLEYLGFKFLFTAYKNPKFALSKFTKVRPDPFIILKNKFSNHSRSGLLVLIRQKSFKKAVFKIKTILSRKNIPLSVKLLIERVNAMIRGIVNYYGHFQSTRVQLKQLDNLIYKRF
jgi:DNA modification methylase